MSEIRTTDAKTLCARLIEDALHAVSPGAAVPSLVLDRPKDPRHGDFACNVALQLARALKRSPRDIANAIVAALPESPVLEKAEVAGAGFINLFLRKSFKQQIVAEV